MAGQLRAELIQLNDGNKMPAVGLGTFQGNYDYTSTYDTVVASVSSAIDIGYRHFDTAWIYDTESGVGAAINAKIRDGAIVRKDVFVTTKLWSPYHRTEEVIPALKRSLEKLGLEYVDMFLVHWPCSMPVTPPDVIWPKDDQGKVLYEEPEGHLVYCWRGMEECKRLGLAKSIGVSNYNIRQLQTILDNCEIKPSNIQVEGHPHFQNQKLVDFCKQYDIVTSCFSPLGKPSRSWAKEGDPSIFTDETIVRLSKKYNKTPAQIALKFQVQRGLAVVPKSNTPERQRDNLDIFDFTLSDEDMVTLKGCDQNFRVLWLDTLRGSSAYPFVED